MQANVVVARYIDGRLIKGTSLNVHQNQTSCHVITDSGRVEVKFAELKALFFVKDPAGDSAHAEAMQATPGDPRLAGGKPIAVEFMDGETIIGVTNHFPPPANRPFFFMLPIDPKSNNVRILVNRQATRTIRAVSKALLSDPRFRDALTRLT